MRPVPHPNNRRQLFDATGAAAALAGRQRFHTADARFAAVADAPAVPGRLPRLAGYAMVWGSVSSDRGGYHVRLAKGSAVAAPTVLALFHHDYRLVIGSTANATVRCIPDDYGLRVEID